MSHRSPTARHHFPSILAAFLAIAPFCQSAIAQPGQATEPKPKVSAVTQAGYFHPELAPQPVNPWSTSGAHSRARRYTYQAYGPGRGRGYHPSHRLAAMQPDPMLDDAPVPTPAIPADENELPTPMAESIAPGSAPEEMTLDGPEFGQWVDGPDGVMQAPASACCGRTPCDTCPVDDCLIGPWTWENLSAFGGVHAFKGPLDSGTNGNFGFHEGVNWGMPFFDGAGIGMQVGGQVVHSNLSGTTTNDDSRTQYFVTAGLFHRPACDCGWQGGVVADYLHDDFFDLDLVQIRTELSIVGHKGHEAGFWTATRANTEHADTLGNLLQVQWEATDMYAFFYRQRFCNGSTARLSLGFTGDKEALIGADVFAPLSSCWALQSGFNYRIPDEDTQALEAARETWGLTINLVWFPFFKNPCNTRNPYRPLFNVADNTTFFIDQDATLANGNGPVPVTQN